MTKAIHPHPNWVYEGKDSDPNKCQHAVYGPTHYTLRRQCTRWRRVKVEDWWFCRTHAMLRTGKALARELRRSTRQEEWGMNAYDQHIVDDQKALADLSIRLAAAEQALADPRFMYAGNRIQRAAIESRNEESGQLLHELIQVAKIVGLKNGSGEDGERLFAHLRALVAAKEQAEQTIAGLRRVLEMVEYAQYFTAKGVSEWCPWCVQGRYKPHKPDCARQLALAAASVDPTPQSSAEIRDRQQGVWGDPPDAGPQGEG